ncbi:MAG: nitroreductase [Clostridia bacterium]|nr:nitroreductase [Clostridia bacterium]
MSDILETIITRRSVKSFKDCEVNSEQIEKVLKAGMYAPSGKNLQSAIIISITNKKVRDMLSSVLANFRGIESDPFYGAPVVLAVLADRSVPTYVYDGSCVIENMLLEAHSLDIGACWIHHAKAVFETDAGKEILSSLNIKGDYEGIGFCVLGYPQVNPSGSIPRKSNYVFKIQ